MCAGACDVREHGRVHACANCVCMGVAWHTHTLMAQTCERSCRSQSREGETGSPGCGGGGGRYQRGQAWLGPTQRGRWGPEHGKDTALPDLEPWPGARCASRQGHQGPFPQGLSAGASTRVNLPPPPNRGLNTPRRPQGMQGRGDAKLKGKEIILILSVGVETTQEAKPLSQSP